MTKKNVVVAAVFLAGLLGGGTAALAFSKPTRPSMAPCAIDMCRDAYGRCVICPDW